MTEIRFLLEATVFPWILGYFFGLQCNHSMGSGKVMLLNFIQLSLVRVTAIFFSSFVGVEPPYRVLESLSWDPM